MFTVGLGLSVSFLAVNGFGLENPVARGAAIGGILFCAAGIGLWGRANYENYYRNQDDRETASLNRDFEKIVQQIDSSDDPGYNGPE